MKQEFGKMLDHSKRVIEYYSSIDPYNTAVYLCHESGENMAAEARIEVVRFGYEGGKHQFYIKFPQDEYFTELVGGISSSQGSMGTGTLYNPWADKRREHIKIYVHDGYMLLSFGKYDSAFNFLKLDARKSGSHKSLYRHSSFPSDFGDHITVTKVLEKDYLKLPMDVKTITYSYKVANENIYIIIDYPTYDCQYDSHDFYVIDNGKTEKMKIEEFIRYRDGGTTYIKVLDSEGRKHVMFSPTKLGSDKKVPLWNDKELIEIPSDELKVIIKILGIEVEKKEQNEQD